MTVESSANPEAAFDLDAFALDMGNSGSIFRGWWLVTEHPDGSWWVYLHPDAGLNHAICRTERRGLVRCVRDRQRFGESFPDLVRVLIARMSLPKEPETVTLIREGTSGPPLLVLDMSATDLGQCSGKYPRWSLVEQFSGPFAAETLAAIGVQANKLRII